MLPIGKEQSENLIAFAQSIEGRNFIKENYIRRRGMMLFKIIEQIKIKFG